MSQTQKALAGTQNPVDPMEVIKRLCEINMTKRIIVEIIKLDQTRVAGEVDLIDRQGKVIVVFVDDEPVGVEFAEINSIECTNPQEVFVG